MYHMRITHGDQQDPMQLQGLPVCAQKVGSHGMVWDGLQKPQNCLACTDSQTDWKHGQLAACIHAGWGERGDNQGRGWGGPSQVPPP